MKLNHKIKLNLFEFFKTGKFDFIEIGKDKNWILNNFPDPDDFEAGKNLYSSRIWRYGNIEFYFENGILTQIFSDYIDSIDAGNNIELEKWIFNEPEKLNAEFVVKSLIKYRIDFKTNNYTTESIYQTSIRIIKSNIHLNFQPILMGENDDYETSVSSEMKNINPNEYRLCSFALAKEDELKTAYNTRL